MFFSYDMYFSNKYTSVIGVYYTLYVSEQKLNRS